MLGKSGKLDRYMEKNENKFTPSPYKNLNFKLLKDTSRRQNILNLTKEKSGKSLNSLEQEKTFQ